LTFESDIRDTNCNKEIDVTNFDSSSVSSPIFRYN
jgi:hypothetical protein